MAITLQSMYCLNNMCATKTTYVGVTVTLKKHYCCKSTKSTPLLHIKVFPEMSLQITFDIRTDIVLWGRLLFKLRIDNFEICLDAIVLIRKDYITLKWL